MTEPLTRKQKAVLDFIANYARENGYPPSVRDIAAHFSFRAVGTVQGYLRTLTAKGYLTHQPDKARSYTVTNYAIPPRDIPILGHVVAGQPVFAPENMSGSLPCGDLVDRPDRTFALQVSGDSMIDAGIRDGDYVLVQKTPAPRNDDIVVARINDEVTVKRFRRDSPTRLTLIPEHPSMKPLIYSSKDKVDILGVVIAVYRKL